MKLFNWFKRKTWKVIGSGSGMGRRESLYGCVSTPTKCWLFVEECVETKERRAYITDGTDRSSYDLNMACAQLNITQ